MGVFYGGERTDSIWGRLILLAMFASYGFAALKHESLMPILFGLGVLFVFALIYYIPLRLIYWMLTGDGEITSRFLIYLPYFVLTVLGLYMVAAEPGTLPQF
ncbi:MAG: hypothetical protein R3C51_11240 [Parvularculaceae bacterium]